MSIIRKSPISLHPVTSRPYLSTSTQWSQHHLLTLRKSIDNSSHTNTKVKQQLKMQRQTTHQFLSQITSTMLATQQSGIDLVAKYQDEKCKHQHLTQLVHHYHQQISQQKLQQHQNLVNNIHTNEYDQLAIELKQKQKLLEAITNKLNSFQSETISSYELVRAERRERTVFSNQFNKFENQLFSLEEKYKQFVIERNLLQKNFDMFKAEFIRLQGNVMRKLQMKEYKDKGLSRAKEQRDSQLHNNPKDPFFKPSPYTSRFQIKPSHSPKILSFDEPNNSRHKKKQQGLQLAIQPSWMRSRSRLMKVEKNQTSLRQFEMNERKLVNLEYKKRMQGVVNEMGLAGMKELKGMTRDGHNNDSDQLMEEITKNNQQRLQEIKSLENTISEWQHQINELKKTIQSLPPKLRKTKSQQILENHLKGIKRMIENTTNEVSSIQEEIAAFNQSKNLTKLMKCLDIDYKSVKEEEKTGALEIDPYLMSQIEEKLFALMSTMRWPQTKPRKKFQTPRESFLFNSIFTHPPQNQSLIHTQKSICPLLSPSSKIRNSKRIKTSVCPASDFQPIKKLSNLLRNQSRFKGPVDVASKEQLISESTEAFGKEGIFRQERFYVNYS